MEDPLIISRLGRAADLLFSDFKGDFTPIAIILIGIHEPSTKIDVLTQNGVQGVSPWQGFVCTKYTQTRILHSSESSASRLFGFRFFGGRHRGWVAGSASMDRPALEDDRREERLAGRPGGALLEGGDGGRRNVNGVAPSTVKRIAG